MFQIHNHNILYTYISWKFSEKTFSGLLIAVRPLQPTHFVHYWPIAISKYQHLQNFNIQSSRILFKNVPLNFVFVVSVPVVRLFRVPTKKNFQRTCFVLNKHFLLGYTCRTRWSDWRRTVIFLDSFFPKPVRLNARQAPVLGNFWIFSNNLITKCSKSDPFGCVPRSWVCEISGCVLSHWSKMCSARSLWVRTKRLSWQIWESKYEICPNSSSTSWRNSNSSKNRCSTSWRNSGIKK